MKASTSAGVLWVCWKRPDTLPDANTVILSFLSPSTEEEVERQYGGILIHAREASLCVRTAARELYLNIVAGIGIATSDKGRTFRQRLARNGEPSPWWYHPVSFRDCESDLAFEWIIAVLTIKKAAGSQGVKDLVFVGAPSPIFDVLKRDFLITQIQNTRPRAGASVWARGFAERAKYLITALKRLRRIRRETTLPTGPFSVALSSFWDWSVSWDSESGSLRDRYYKELPNDLGRLGARVGWFAWLEPNVEPGKEHRPLSEVLANINDSDRVIILQCFLSAWDVFRAIFDIRPLILFIRNRRRSEFGQAFQVDGLNFFSLFRAQLLSGFLDSSLARQDLVNRATLRACQKYKPGVLFSFLEHFPHARAQYDAVRRANTATTSYAVQHASYSCEKTFLSLHPSIEFKSVPDGFGVPHPDYVCAMGTLGQELFLECGYPNDAVMLTGSPRYDHVTIAPVDFVQGESREKQLSGPVRVLMVCSLDIDLELEMVEALCAALRGVDGMQLFLRNHPFRRIENDPKFAPFGSRIEITTGSLDEDLKQADLILFTYSTVAEEALLKGMPVWQWLALGPNRSALADVIEIPRFGSVVKLREALVEFKANPSRFAPNRELRERALEKLFYRADGGAARRVSDAYLKLVGQVTAQAEGGSSSAGC